MEKTIVKKNNKRRFNRQLKDYIDSLDSTQRRITSLLIRDGCMIDYHKYYRWLNAGVIIEPLYRQKIEEIIGQHIFH